MQTLEMIKKYKIIAILRGYTKEQTHRTAEALLKGGIRLIEATFDQSGNPEDTAQTIQDLCAAFGSEAQIGAGTVMNPKQVDIAYQAGAKYIISPNTDEDVIKRTKELGLISMPGALTPTEITQAYKFGGDIIKIFPANILGVPYIKAIRAPLHHIPMSAVGGIDKYNIADFLKTGVCCVGVGGKLADSHAIAAGKYNELSDVAIRMCSAIRDAE